MKEDTHTRAGQRRIRVPFYRTFKTWLRIQLSRSRDWSFSKVRQAMYINEYDEWLTYYLPIPVKDLVVLDVGAGEGETARFYLEHGARKVICIEPDTPSFKLLEKNAAGKPIMCLNKKFELTDLKMDFDFMKMDIEGYEETLLSASLKQPCVIEVHGLQLRDKFMKAGYNIRNFPMYSEFGAVSYAYLNLPCSCKR